MSKLIKNIQVSKKTSKAKLLPAKEPFCKEDVHSRFALLKSREKEVAMLLIAGLMSKDIAVKLNLTPATIKVHKARMMKKMQVCSLQELVAVFIKSELA